MYVMMVMRAGAGERSGQALSHARRAAVSAGQLSRRGAGRRRARRLREQRARLLQRRAARAAPSLRGRRLEALQRGEHSQSLTLTHSPTITHSQSLTRSLTHHSLTHPQSLTLTNEC